MNMHGANGGIDYHGAHIGSGAANANNSSVSEFVLPVFPIPMTTNMDKEQEAKDASQTTLANKGVGDMPNPVSTLP